MATLHKLAAAAPQASPRVWRTGLQFKLWIGIPNFGPPSKDKNSQLHPVVPPQVSHFRQVPLRTRVKFMHSGQASPS